MRKRKRYPLEWAGESIEDRDAPAEAMRDRILHLGRAEGLDESFALQLLLVRVHRERDVDGDHQGEIRVGLRSGGMQAEAGCRESGGEDG